MTPTYSSSLNSNVNIRPFRPEDKEQVSRLFYTGTINGSGSPFRFIIHHIFTRWKPTYIMYLAFVSGLGAAIVCKGKARYLGLSLAASVPSFLIYVSRRIHSMFVRYCENALRTDLADISQYYKPTMISEESDTKSATSGFWVGEIPSSTSKDGFEIIACVGLDGSTSEDPTESELRRMFVSPSHRQRGIATKLIGTVIEYAKACRLSSLYLETTTMQPAAMQMYSRLGWTKTKAREYSESEVGIRPVFVTYRLHLDEINKET